MPIFARRRSYAEAFEERRRFGKAFVVFLLFFLCFETVTSLFLVAYSAGSSSMSPTILPSDLVLAAPIAYGPRTIFGKLPGTSRPERGDIVVADPPYAVAPGFFGTIADSFVRFITFQRLSLYEDADPTRQGAVIERVIGVPGDTILMEDFVYKVRPASSPHFLTEFELSTRRYDIAKEALPEGWLDDMPASGSMPPRVLGADEYFLAGDSRSAAGGSRLWGPVKRDRLLGKVLLRYWPFKRFGAL
jgi:signal peptidase I